MLSQLSTDSPEGPSLGVSLRTYPNRQAECSIWPDDGKPKKYHKRKVMHRDEQSDETINAAISRTRKCIRHNVMAMSGDRLWTLTYRENQMDVNLAWHHWKMFLQRCRRNGISFQYVVVAERQERGAIHFHFVGNQYLNVNVLRHHWRKITGDVVVDGETVANGTVHVTTPKKGKKWKPYKLAAYLSKYITKDLVTEFGKHRYKKSRGDQKIEVKKNVIYFGRGLSLYYLEMIFKEQTGLDVRSVYQMEYNRYWLCTWDMETERISRTKGGFY